METSNIVRDIASLPPVAQKHAHDFIAMLKEYYTDTNSVQEKRQTRLADEPFIGMWEGNNDMQNSTEWVRSLRQRECKERI
jgi:hypothetical protein